MSLTVRDVMNRQLLYVHEGEPVAELRHKILQFGVSGVPVLDAMLRPAGFVSLRDFSADGASAVISTPVVTVPAAESIEGAARKLAATELRRLVVVDDSGVVVGMVSATDLLRGLLGLPASHPARFDVDCSSADAFADPTGDAPATVA